MLRRDLILAVGAAIALLAGAAPAHADWDDWRWHRHERDWRRGDGWRDRGWAYSPPPVYYAPPPVYYAPPPVYYPPPPRYYYAQPRPYFGFGVR